MIRLQTAGAAGRGPAETLIASAQAARCSDWTSSKPSNNGSTWSASTHAWPIVWGTSYRCWSSSTSQTAKGRLRTAQDDRGKTTGISCSGSWAVRWSKSRESWSSASSCPPRRAQDEQRAVETIEDVHQLRARCVQLVGELGALDEDVQSAGDQGGVFGQAQVQQDVLRERGLEHAGDPDGPDLLDHRPPITAVSVGAARVPEILLNGHPAEGEITADGDVVKLDLGSRLVTSCP